MKHRLQDRSNELDLHGVRHHDVDRVVENFVILKNPPFTIITGKSEKMRNLVIDVLDRNLHQWDIPVLNQGVIKVLK